MANNRMYLMHRPTRLALYLGKHMGWGWYDAPEDSEQRLTAFFERVQDECKTNADNEDFCLAMESCDSGMIFTKWDKAEKDGDFFRLREANKLDAVVRVRIERRKQ